MSAQRPRKPPQQALSIDDVEIDFSGIAKAQAEVESGKQLAALVAAAAQDQQQQQQMHDGQSGPRALDPGLTAYVQRSVESSVGRRRKRMFGGAATTEEAKAPAVVASETTAADATGSAPVAEPSLLLQAASADTVAAFLAETSTPSRVALRERESAYRRALHAFCTSEASAEAARTAPTKPEPTHSPAGTAAPPSSSSSPPAAATPRFPASASQTNSLIEAFLDEGVPDMEPWDQWAFTMPRYDAKALAVHAHNPKTIANAKMDLVPHPVLPPSVYMARYAAAARAPVPLKLMKTKDELRAERKERLKLKQQRAREARERKKAEGVTAGLKSGGDGPAGSAAAQGHDRVSFKHMAYNLFDDSVLNPLGVDNKVLAGYQDRFLEHQRQNHARHVEALPNQIAKRERDARRHAEEDPFLCAYRVYPIYGPQHLGMLRNFANDNRLRGFILWVAQCDALLVLSGGRVAIRHLDRWILEKTDWEFPQTHATRLCRVPLPDWQAFSFHSGKKHPAGHQPPPASKKARTEATDGSEASDPRKKVDDDREHVFINHVDTVEEGEWFLRTMVPAGGTPWCDLCTLWRSAFLGTGLAKPTDDAKDGHVDEVPTSAARV